MPSLPVDGEGNWGRKLNEFLLVSHREDGHLRNAHEVVNVKDFGAIGDGVPHPLQNYFATIEEAKAIYPHAMNLQKDDLDWAAIQAALNQVLLTGGIVYIPPGTYRITDRLSFQNETLSSRRADGVTVLGVGYASFLAFDHQLQDGHGIGFNGIDARNITIRDLRIGTFPNGAGFIRGIYFSGGSKITIRDNEISGATAILGTIGYPSGIYLHGAITDVQLLDNYLHDNGVKNASSWQIVIDPLANARRVRICGNRCITDPESAHTVNYGIAVFDSTDVEISGNYIEGVAAGVNVDADGYGIMLYGSAVGASHHHLVQGNIVKRTGGTGIYIQASPYTAVTGNIIEDVAKIQYAGSLAVGGIGFNQGPGSITGNVIRNVGIGNTTAVLPFGIVIQTCETCGGITDEIGRGITVAGNTIESTMNYGIALEAAPLATADNSTIIGNTLVNTRGGITTLGDAPTSGLTIIGNSIIRTHKSPLADSTMGIFLNAVNNSTIVGNVVANASGQGIVLYANANRNVVSGNIVRNSGQRENNAYPGIQVTGAHNLITGNESYNSGVTASGQNWGILEAGLSNEITNNNVSGNLNPAPLGIYSTGSNTTRAENRLTEDKRQGTCTLSGGQCQVVTAETRAGDMILLNRITANGTLGHLSVQNIIAGSFEIISSSTSDTSEIFWKIIH